MSAEFPPKPPADDKKKTPESMDETMGPEVYARSSRQLSKWERIMEDPAVKDGLPALIRTVANVGITLADVVPVLGAKFSWGADILKSKTVNKLAKRLFGIERIDLTPSVSRKLAWGTELIELPTFLLAPTHAIEAILQFKREDRAKLRLALEAIRRHLNEEQADYQNNKAKIDEAINNFKNPKNGK